MKAEQNLAVVTAPPPIIDAEFEAQPAHVPLAHYLWILRRHAWKIAAFVIAASFATLIGSLRLTPIYESTATVDVDRQMPTGVLGQEALQNVTNDADDFGGKPIAVIDSKEDLPANRILVRKQFLRGRATQDNDEWLIGGVTFLKFATSEKWDA